MGKFGLCVAWHHFEELWEQNDLLGHQKLGWACRGTGNKKGAVMWTKQGPDSVFCREVIHNKC